jgi:hypothetical protein
LTIHPGIRKTNVSNTPYLTLLSLFQSKKRKKKKRKEKVGPLSTTTAASSAATPPPIVSISLSSFSGFVQRSRLGQLRLAWAVAMDVRAFFGGRVGRTFSRAE